MDSTQKVDPTKKAKPSKPYADFPLFPHATGRWAKKIRGKLHYFGPWRDPDAALNKYLDQRDDLHAGRTSRINGDGLTVRDLCNQFLTNKRHLLDTQEIVLRTWRDYHCTCQRIVDAFGTTRLVNDLVASDFERLRTSIAKNWGPVGLGNEIGRVRMVFKFALDQGLVDKPIRYGQSFKKPSRKVLRQTRARNGTRMFEAVELRQILAAACQPLQTMILLGINCGFGQTDVSNLPKSAMDLRAGWVDYPRPKTGVQRRCPLWTETVNGLEDVAVKPPVPKDRADANLTFLTKYGRRWVRTYGNGTPDDAIGKEFAKLLKSLGLKRPGVSFYALRHTFATIGGEARDQVAVNAIMGHTDTSMSAVYRERISDERLQAVADYVHDWLYSK